MWGVCSNRQASAGVGIVAVFVTTTSGRVARTTDAYEGTPMTTAVPSEARRNGGLHAWGPSRAVAARGAHAGVGTTSTGTSARERASVSFPRRGTETVGCTRPVSARAQTSSRRQRSAPPSSVEPWLAKSTRIGRSSLAAVGGRLTARSSIPDRRTSSQASAEQPDKGAESRSSPLVSAHLSTWFRLRIGREPAVATTISHERLSGLGTEVEHLDASSHEHLKADRLGAGEPAAQRVSAPAKERAKLARHGVNLLDGVDRISPGE